MRKIQVGDLVRVMGNPTESVVKSIDGNMATLCWPIEDHIRWELDVLVPAITAVTAVTGCIVDYTKKSSQR